MSLHIERFTLRSASYHDSGSASDFETDASKGDDALSIASTFRNGFRNEEDYAISGQVETKMRQISLLSADGRPSDEKKIVGMDTVVFEARFSSAGGCPQPCRCRCHSSRPSAVRYPNWIGTLIGSLSVTYDQHLLLGGNSECTDLGCKGTKRSSATFGYQLPAWLCAKFISFQVYTDSFRELRSSLRSVRVVPNNDDTLLAIELHDQEAVRGSMLAYGRLLPDDRTPDGQHIIMVSTCIETELSFCNLTLLTQGSSLRLQLIGQDQRQWNFLSNFGLSIYAKTLIIREGPFGHYGIA